MNQNSPKPTRAATGITGFDAFTKGGFPLNRLYLLEGDPGVGKTTFSLQFLLEGARAGEKVLLVSLAETTEELKEVADSHGWDLAGINVFHVAPPGLISEDYSIIEPSEVELTETMQRIFEEVDRIKPTRLVLDSLSELRLLAQTPLRYRRQILNFKRFFMDSKCTVLMLDDRSGDNKYYALQSLVHGVVELERYSPIYGKARRRIQAVKLRGVNFNAGFHDFNITSGGIEVYPRLIAASHKAEFEKEICSTNIKNLDDILGGGIDRGTTTLILGPAGCGKSTLGALLAVVAAERGEKAAIFTFDEGLETLITRAKGLGMDLEPFIASGAITVSQVDPAAMSPGEFMWHVKGVVEKKDVKFVLIDSLTGYLDAMPESQFLTIQMHEMLTYLNQQGILTVLTMAQHGYMGSSMQSPADISYLADTVILLRYFESAGEIKKAISVVKKRTGRHHTAIREYAVGPTRVHVGHELKEFHGILTGTPVFTGPKSDIIEQGNGTPRR